MERLLVINYSRLAEDEQSRLDDWASKQPGGWTFEPISRMLFVITHKGTLYALYRGELVLIP